MGILTAPHKRFHRWWEKKIWLLLCAELARFDGTEPEGAVLLIDAIYVKAHGMAASKGGAAPCLIGHTRRDLTSDP